MGVILPRLPANDESAVARLPQDRGRLNAETQRTRRRAEKEKEKERERERERKKRVLSVD
jgi:hypothetical protein